MNNNLAVVSCKLSQFGVILKGKEGGIEGWGGGGGGLAPVAAAAAAAKGSIEAGGGGGGKGNVPDGVNAARAQKSWVRSAKSERIVFCWVVAPKNRGEGVKILPPVEVATPLLLGAFVMQLPPLALLEMEAGDEAHSPVGEDFGIVEACATVDGGGDVEAIEVVEAKEVIEK